MIVHNPKYPLDPPRTVAQIVHCGIVALQQRPITELLDGTLWDRAYPDVPFTATPAEL